jgi:hypothetical protein
MFHALIDSGADVNLFPANLAILLNIDLESGRRINVYGIGRHKLQAYEHKIYLHIGKHIFRGVAYFSPENQDPLLGRRGFFDLFKKVSFREKERVVVLGS